MRSLKLHLRRYSLYVADSASPIPPAKFMVGRLLRVDVGVRGMAISAARSRGVPFGDPLHLPGQKRAWRKCVVVAAGKGLVLAGPETPEIHRLNPETGTDVKFSSTCRRNLAGLFQGDGGFAFAAADGVTILSPDMTESRPWSIRSPMYHIASTMPNVTGKVDFGRVPPTGGDRTSDVSIVSTPTHSDDLCRRFHLFQRSFVQPRRKDDVPHVSHERTIYAYDLDLAGGEISNRRVFVVVGALEGVPDGSPDAELFLVDPLGGSRITRYAPDGRIDRKIECR